MKLFPMHRLRFAAPVMIAAALAACVTCTNSASADLSYTLTVDLSAALPPSMSPDMLPTITTLYSYKGDVTRIESQVSGGRMPIGRDTITLLDAGQDKVFEIDPTQNIYASYPLSGSEPDIFGLTAAMSGMPGSTHKRIGPVQGQAGTVTTNVSVQDVGMETVNAVSAHHWSITMTQTATGSVQIDPRPIKIDMWTDNAPRPLSSNLKRAFGDASAPAAPAKSDVNYVMTGDVAKLETIATQTPVKIEVALPFPGRNAAVVLNRTNVSSAPLDSSLFTLPPGATEVTPDEFAVKQRVGMMQRIRRPQPGAGAPIPLNPAPDARQAAPAVTQ